MSYNFNEIANELSMGYEMPDANGLLQKLGASSSGLSESQVASLINIIEKSDGVPKPIIDWLIKKLSDDIILSGRVDSVACHNLRHLLFSCASDNGTIISEAEAEILFIIKDATIKGNNAPEWKDFFSKAIANHLMAHNFDDIQAKVNRADYAFHKQNFFKMVAEVLGNKSESVWQNSHTQSQIESDNKITGIENAWLDKNISKDGKIDEYDQAVLDFISAG